MDIAQRIIRKSNGLGDAATTTVELGPELLSTSAGLEFPIDAINAARAAGFDTTTVGSVLSKMGKIANGKDPHSGLTDGAVSRSELLVQAIKVVLAKA